MSTGRLQSRRQPVRLRYLFVTLVAIALSTAGAHADSIDITLVPVTQSGAPGTTVTFDATLTNLTSSTIFLNGGTATTSSSFLAVDDNPFLNNAPLELLAGSSNGPFPLFSVLISAGTPQGNYGFNTFTILGGTGSTNLNMVGSTQFDLNVAVAPEPGTLVLLTSGLIGLGMKLRFGKARKPEPLNS